MKIRYILYCLIFFPLAGFTQTDLTGISEKFNSVIKEANDKEVFSGNVLVEKDGNIFYKNSIGYADEISKTPNDAGTKFQTGSITKFFTKTMIHQLAEENKINMSDKLSKYISGFAPEAGDEITIQQLLDHTSGLGDYINESGGPQAFMNVSVISDLLPFIQKSQLHFKPGSGVQYSNSGYAVLANIIEKIEGRKYGDVLKERIFDRIKMNNSGFTVVNTDITGKAKGYLSNQLGEITDNTEMRIIGAGDGGIFTTTEDLYKFAKSLASDNLLLSDESKVNLFNTPLFPVHYSSWDEFTKKGRLTIAGGAPGISAVMGINMEKNYIMVILSNYDQGTAEDVARRVSAVLNDKPVEPFNPPPARMVYNLIKEKGKNGLASNYKSELSAAGIRLDDDMILLYAGREFLREKDADNAVILYTIYTTEFPEIVVAWNDMGDAYLMKGDKENARKSFEQALKIRPGNQRAKQSLDGLK